MLRMSPQAARQKREDESGKLDGCTFAPRTGRGPVSGPRATVAGLPAPTTPVRCPRRQVHPGV